MASGLPDYQVEYKINTGGLRQISGSKVIVGVGYNVLTSIVDKGVIIGGRILCDFGLASHKTDMFSVDIDNRSMNVSSFENINKWGLDKMYTSFLYELLFDDVNFEYCLGFPNGVTFESSVLLGHTTFTGNCTVLWQLLYSLYQ